MVRVTSTLDRYQRIAAFYDLLDYPFEQGRYRHLRPQLFEGLSGRILDAGVGTGRNPPTTYRMRTSSALTSARRCWRVRGNGPNGSGVRSIFA
jgi:hypothetical protein